MASSVPDPSKLGNMQSNVGLQKTTKELKDKLSRAIPDAKNKLTEIGGLDIDGYVVAQLFRALSDADTSVGFKQPGSVVDHTVIDGGEVGSG